MKKLKKLHLQKKRRALKKVVGTTERPRLAVFRSHKHIYAQLIDDSNARTIVMSSTVEKSLASQIEKTATKEASFLVGKKVGEKAREKNVTNIVFDRGNKPYHGRIQSVAEGARETGLNF
jgi:large subunit ribosomal protein L18